MIAVDHTGYVDSIVISIVKIGPVAVFNESKQTASTGNDLEKVDNHVKTKNVNIWQLCTSSEHVMDEQLKNSSFKCFALHPEAETNNMYSNWTGSGGASENCYGFESSLCTRKLSQHVCEAWGQLFHELKDIPGSSSTN